MKLSRFRGECNVSVVQIKAVSDPGRAGISAGACQRFNILLYRRTRTDQVLFPVIGNVFLRGAQDDKTGFDRYLRLRPP